MQYSRKFLLPVLSLLVVLAAALTLGLAQISTAQDNPSEPTWLPAPADEANRSGSTQPENQQRVAYLVDAEAPLGYEITHTAAAEVLQAEIFMDWGVFASAHDVASFQAVVIDASAYPWIDRSLTQEFYRRGTIIIGRNLDWDTMTIITGDFCVSRGRTANETFVGADDMTIYAFILTPTVEAERGLLESALLAECSSGDNSGGYSLRHAYYNWILLEPSSFSYVVSSLDSLLSDPQYPSDLSEIQEG